MPRPVKRSFTIGGHRTSISLEAPFWDALKDIAQREGLAAAVIVQRIDRERANEGLSSAVRLWIFDYFRRRIPADNAAHVHAGDGTPADIKE
jgi:predicted DNA-binding ribbon-helix-helix protein